MAENLLYDKLKELSKEDFKEFIKFAASPIFNSNKRIPELLRLLLPAHPNLENNPIIAKNKLVKALGLKSEEALRQLRTPTLQLLPLFYTVMELQKRRNASRLLLLDALEARHLRADLQAAIEDFENDIDPDDRPFHTRFRLDDFRLQELLRKPDHVSLYERYIESGNRYFLLKKLKQACHLLLFPQIYNKAGASPLFRELEFLLPLHEEMLAEHPVLRSWQHLYELMRHPTQSSIEPLLTTLAQNKQAIPRKEQKDLLNTVNNLLIGRLTQGYYNTLEEMNWFYDTLLRQYRFATAENLLPESGFIQHGRFKNVVAVASITGAFDWARSFMEENLHQVLPEHREDLRYFCLCTLAFYENDLRAAAKYMTRISTRGSDFYYFDLESIQMRIFLLENEIDLFEARSDAVRKKLTSSQLSQAHLANYGNYFKLLKELFYLAYDPNSTPAQWAAFQQKVENTNPVNQKKWLLEFIQKNKKK